MSTVWDTKTNVTPAPRLGQNVRYIAAPLLQVSPAAQIPPAPKPDDILVFTSGNGVRSFSTLTDNRDWTIYTVGDATAERAKGAGFSDVISAGKDVAALRDLIMGSSKLKTKRLYYATGQDVSGDLEGDLNNSGFHIIRAIVYETHPVTALPTEIYAVLEANTPLTVLLYSSKAAKVFRALNLDFSQIDAMSMSENVDKHLSNLGLNSRLIAKEPTFSHMIKAFL